MILAVSAAKIIPSADKSVKPNPDIALLEEAPNEPTEVSQEQFRKNQEELEKMEKWYRSLTEEQRLFINEKVDELHRQQESKLNQEKMKHQTELKKYLLKNLQKSQYTQLSETSIEGLEIGVPSAKYIEKIENLKNQFYDTRKDFDAKVDISYQICKYSAKELDKAKTALEKDESLKKLMLGKGYVFEIYESQLFMYCPNQKPKTFESWLQKSGYQDMLVVKDGQKPNPDTANTEL